MLRITNGIIGKIKRGDRIEAKREMHRVQPAPTTKEEGDHVPPTPIIIPEGGETLSVSRGGKIPEWDVEKDSAAGLDLVIPKLFQRFPQRPRKKQNRMHLTYEQMVKPLEKFLQRDLVSKGAQPLDLTEADIHGLLSTDDFEVEASLFDYANMVTEKFYGPNVSFRGIIEFSNVCQKSCGYCGIRKHRQVPRYTMKKDEMVQLALWAFDHGYGSLMLQSGELPTPQRHEFMCDLIRTIKKVSIAREIERDGVSPEKARGLGVAIGLGELSKKEYAELFEAGAHRYLLRIETSNPELYARLHPADHYWQQRHECLNSLREIGYQLGTGIMIALPGQTLTDLTRDILYFRDMQADMIGCGPYLYQEHTPIGDIFTRLYPAAIGTEGPFYGELLELCSRFVSLVRIVLGDVNISSTTALQVLSPVGRELVLTRGANQMMPILTLSQYRKDYQLYTGKPCIDEGHEGIFYFYYFFIFLFFFLFSKY